MTLSVLPYTTVTQKVSDLLDVMAETGLWGETPEEVVRHLVYEGVQGALGRGLIPANDPPPVDLSAIVDAYPPQHGPNCDCTPDTLTDCGEEGCQGAAPRPAGRSIFKCGHCRDGLDEPKDMTPGGNCPECGTLCEIPF